MLASLAVLSVLFSARRLVSFLFEATITQQMPDFDGKAAAMLSVNRPLIPKSKNNLS